MGEHVDKVIKRLERGATEPVEGIINGKMAIIKTFNNVFSNKVLINEYICLKLANLLSLTIPHGGICVIDNETKIENEFASDLTYNDETILGVGYYSIRIDRANDFIPNNQLVLAIKNREEINKLILFDHLIYNDDRHEGNILLHLREAKMYIIDHSHVFKLKHRWDKEKLQKNIDNEDYKDINILECNLNEVYKPFAELKIINRMKLQKVASEFKSLIDENILDNIINELPEEWTNSCKDDICLLKKYILYRLDNIDNIVEVICTFLNLERGE